MEKTYRPELIEQRWYQFWEEQGYFQPSSTQTPAYCIVIPPPNVTGSLHMGHGFQHSLMDVLIRYHRMQGRRTLWQVGTDHAGIATQMVVERQLLAEGIERKALGRQAFVKKVHEWKEYSSTTITQQIRRLGASVDWTRERFTMDPDFCRAVTQAFVQLYREGYIYQGQRLVNWDPKFQTAISDLEVIASEEQGQLWYIRYPLLDSQEHLIVSTTRPETMLGDVAVAVHPMDERYRHLIGKSIRLPLTNRIIPIIGDDYVDPEFGSGCVKITPAHDFNDYAIGQRHALPLINIFTPTAHLNENVPEKYRGFERYQARQVILEELKQQGLLFKVDEHVLKVPRGDRSGEVIEPYLTNQWFIRMKPLAEPAIKAVQDGHIQFVPENWTKTYYQWLENIEDWCISRQLWWGHRIPAWYDDQGNCYVGYDEADIRAHYQLAQTTALFQDEDVLDTWFSAALWPFATLGWPAKTEELATYYPTNVLVTGFDIIFFWIARMVMFGLKFTDQVPFQTVYVTGLVRDSQGQKMSKSKGNIIDPIDLIDGISLPELLKKRTHGLLQPQRLEAIKAATQREFPNGIPSFGTDALRFTFCALANTGRDIRFDLNRLNGYRNFCNKLWNAARYVFMVTEEKDNGVGQENLSFSLVDHWIQSRLQLTVQAAIEHLNHYRFDLLAQTIHDFIWHEYCDWYLEFTKPILQAEQENPAAAMATRYTLLTVLESLLRLLHPIMPFITEEIWQRAAPLAGKSGQTIMLQPFPQPQREQIHYPAIEVITWLQQLITAVRTVRSEMNIAPGKPLPVLFRNAKPIEQERLTANQTLFCTLAKVSHITWQPNQEPLPPTATQLVGSLEIHIPLADLIDKQTELARLQKELAKLEQDIQRAARKLNNPNFIAKAPQDVVLKTQKQLLQWQTTYQQLNQQLERINQL